MTFSLEGTTVCWQSFSLNSPDNQLKHKHSSHTETSAEPEIWRHVKPVTQRQDGTWCEALREFKPTARSFHTGVGALNSESGNYDFVHVSGDWIGINQQLKSSYKSKQGLWHTTAEFFLALEESSTGSWLLWDSDREQTWNSPRLPWQGDEVLHSARGRNRACSLTAAPALFPVIRSNW